MRRSLGRIYRYALWNDFSSTPFPLSPIDPLSLERRSTAHGAKRYGSPLVLEVAGENGVGQVEVTFSELPVNRWQTWSVEQKRHFGIVGGGGVSIVRAQREIREWRKNWRLAPQAGLDQQPSG
jgi:hypothetical protein